ncbi:serine protease [Enterococcus plantarum]|uniref:Serine protease n=1 Tax=Enterococcus plantarum TaxID=1077675 RepID=A0A2W4BTD0_9ENTE|nr:trypsin-like peptidase domain-containing protein [Enterococcus plantarum]MBO0423092.1 trypsin-like peptidase domain-containing protein [Enterococcus plantarum]MBO0468134.1 trypsin-like peptidase domain-containing protein [Enterococcus plantarum]OEG11177.1 serine protease [Enterococcus plantarum]PZL76479.1 serine protease [Enterococcus plantarum]
MQKKDVTPNSDKKQNGLFKKFGIGLVGGLLGGALAFGGAYVITGQSPSSNSSTTTNTVKDNKGDTKVTNVNLDVTSDVTKAVDKVKDSVVSVINLQSPSQNTSDGGFGSIFGGNDGSQEDSSNSDGSDLQAASEGSGVIYKKDGKTAYVVTNNHVVDQAKGLEVVLHDGTKVQGELVGTDSYTDLAVIKISSDKVDSIAEFGNSDKLKIGEPALAIGSPLGSAYANSVTQGIISSLNRNIQNENNGQAININAIQTDAAINPGNSGGPLVNIEGQVIGINSVKIVQSESQVSVEGMGFAIPSNDVVNIINQLEKEGKVTRPALGISMEELTNVSTQQRKEILKLPESVQMGVLVRTVQTATPADKAGIERYDVITKIDDKDIDSVTDLQSALYKKKVGDKMKVTFYRDGKEQSVDVDLTIDQSALKQNSSNSDNSQNP